MILRLFPGKEHRLIPNAPAEKAETILPGKRKDEYSKISHRETDCEDGRRMHAGSNKGLGANESHSPDRYYGQGQEVICDLP